MVAFRSEKTGPLCGQANVVHIGGAKKIWGGGGLRQLLQSMQHSVILPGEAAVHFSDG